MIELQVLNKIIKKGDWSIIADNYLAPELFNSYKKEFNFIVDFHKQFDKVPDIETMLDNFPEFKAMNVTEQDEYLIHKLRETSTYPKVAEILQKTADKALSNSFEAVEYLNAEMSKLSVDYNIKTVDIMNDVEARKKAYLEEDLGKTFIPTGFEELDQMVGGWHRGEELVVLFARTGNGKSFTLVKTLTYAWEKGYNVGFVTPEMSANRVGYRVDSAYKGFSNTNLIRGEAEEGYIDYLDNLKSENGFYVSEPSDFGEKITVGRIRQWAKQSNLDMVAIDGIDYMADERGRKGDNNSTRLKNISADLMTLSRELGIPILIVVQANREASKGNEMPELSHIRDSDGISYNCSKAISLRSEVTEEGSTIMEMKITKNRDGATGDELQYAWSPDRAQFTYMANNENIEENERKIDLLERKFADEDKIPF